MEQEKDDRYRPTHVLLSPFLSVSIREIRGCFWFCLFAFLPQYLGASVVNGFEFPNPLAYN